MATQLRFDGFGRDRRNVGRPAPEQPAGMTDLGESCETTTDRRIAEARAGPMSSAAAPSGQGAAGPAGFVTAGLR
ncbi:hypothetical protein [Amycolatopsis sp. DSM 110486]|uniref:hypothetical protein n=1 Tax=Amycolatopsis sp. DSM 110486 TaxID=2865832 RepID=UPI001C6A8D61|nr:hypothetical protein [Amycolatopsis sp. DSM 110486]QYN20285.1 hypothetical protein K1T34_48490 [Amycolatopsis sp. DSM 110486]